MNEISQAPQEKSGGFLTALRKVKEVVVKAEMIIAVILLVVLGFVLIYQVFTRYVLSDPQTWTEEAARFIFIWMIFIGSAMLASKNAHIAVTFITTTVKAPIARWIVRGAALITAVSAGVVAWAGFEFVSATAHLPSAAMGIPMLFVYLAPAISYTFIAIHSLEFIVTGTEPTLEEEMQEALV